MKSDIHTYVHIRGSKRNVVTVPVYDAHEIHAVASEYAAHWRQRVQVYAHDGERMPNAGTCIAHNASKHMAGVERRRAEVRPARIADKRERAAIRERKRAERAERKREREERERKRKAAIERVQARMRAAGESV